MDARYFHIFNRGLDKRIIFPEESYYDRFLITATLSRLANAPKTTAYFKQEKLGLIPKDEAKRLERWSPQLVTIICYCLMPNHFHFLVKEEIEGGVAKFMQRLGDGYTKYFNIRQEREGRLFTAKYKRVLIQSDEQLIHVSRYMHLNPVNSSLTKISLANIKEYSWSSLNLYLNKVANLLCEPDEVMKFFEKSDYWDFVSAGYGDSVEQFPKDIFIDEE